MSTKLKSFLSEIANKLKANGENLYQRFLFYIPDEKWDLTKQDWTILNYDSHSISSVSQTSTGMKIVVSDKVYYSGVFIKLGTYKECVNKTFTASIDEVKNVTIYFGGMDSAWDVSSYGERNTSKITLKFLPEHIPDYWGTDNNWFGIWLVFDQAGTYNINNIVIKDVSPINAKEYPTKIDNVYQSGRNEEKKANEFMNNYLYNIRMSYGGKFAFAGDGWDDTTFNPNSDINNTLNGKLNFENFFTNSRISDLKGILKRNGVKLVTSKAEYFDNFAYYSSITRFPELDMATAQRLSQCFTGCSKLVSIDKIILSSTKTQVFTSTFTGCLALEEIRFEGYIRSNISFSSSPLLSYESLKSIIGCLYNFVASGDTSAHTLTLHQDAKARLDSADIAIANAKGWTIA